MCREVVWLGLSEAGSGGSTAQRGVCASRHTRSYVYILHVSGHTKMRANSCVMFGDLALGKGSCLDVSAYIFGVHMLVYSKDASCAP